jgi:hypothetical protein
MHKPKRPKFERDDKEWYLSKQGQAMLDEVRPEGERGRILIAVAFLDNGLRECLRLRFGKHIIDEGLVDHLLDEDRQMLATFGARIQLCRALSLISYEDYCALEAMRLIRNALAHEGFLVPLSRQEFQSCNACLAAYVTSRACGLQFADGGNPWPRVFQLKGILLPDAAHEMFLSAAMDLMSRIASVCYELSGNSEQYSQAVF